MKPATLQESDHDNAQHAIGQTDPYLNHEVACKGNRRHIKSGTKQSTQNKGCDSEEDHRRSHVDLSLTKSNHDNRAKVPCECLHRKQYDASTCGTFSPLTCEFLSEDTLWP